ncbi:hypothetical protein NDU88_000770 [Pleurodeles waltl]|uniref:Uncharacterized protein n=1 Tax=Pleurodeles waltl TaxID=8319 RepID=A0AAV7LVN9_PLEWA|nr:hypothetical protein NDU88_000770 [Pleurodeles waltl]
MGARGGGKRSARTGEAREERRGARGARDFCSKERQRALQGKRARKEARAEWGPRVTEEARAVRPTCVGGAG